MFDFGSFMTLGQVPAQWYLVGLMLLRLVTPPCAYREQHTPCISARLVLVERCMGTSGDGACAKDYSCGTNASLAQAAQGYLRLVKGWR
jgi:hypothetical protein